MLDCNHGFYVVHDTACICRKHFGIDFASGHCVDQLTLSSLRILCQQFTDLHPGLILNQFLQFCNCIRFVIFDAKHTFCMVKQLQYDLHTCNQIFRIFDHSAVICSQIWLAFCAVCNNILDFFRLFRRQFYMCRETCASHTNHTGLLNSINDFLPG